MSMPSTATRPPARRTPVRLPRGALSRRARGVELLQGAVATLLLLGVVAGVPLALVALLGNPLPTTLPGRAWLDAEVTASSVLDVLAVVLWGVWLHFVVCVVAEFRAWARGTRGRVPLGSGNQLLARRLVAAVLLLSAGAVWVPGTASAVGAVLSTATVSATTSMPSASGGAEAGSARTAVAVAADEPDAGWRAAEPAPAGAAPVAYLVQPPLGRHHDCLWDIAERTLGDPLRYQEIFELNRNRVQPDGSRLVDADLIRPGWTLLLPADAVGAGPQVLTVPTPAAPAVVAPHGTGTPAPTAPGDADLLQRSVLSGGLLAVGLLTATRRWQAADGSAPAPRGLDDPDRAEFLDTALRSLADAVRRRGSALPEVVAARLGAEEVHLHLAGDAGTPPAPWRADAATVWSLRRSDLDAAGPATGRGTPAPYPALADVARAGDDDLLVDLEAAPGLVALAGDAAVAKALALSLAAELALNPWSDGVGVHLVGFATAHAPLAPASITDAATLERVLQELEAEASGHERVERALGVDGVVSGRSARDAQRRRPRVVVLSGPPGAGDAQRLDRLVAAGRTPFAVVVVGDVATARWRFTCTPDGAVDLGPLGVHGRAVQLDEEGFAELTAMSRAFG
ncbi:hypothetical protein [Kineococcus rubinsiae]|uniref:hypothetical protein n=1 Tax=Kineococcus rubinsiae TaxID=2609562 RepID=UPI0014310FC5|nr:hypothetical protein [Kineococcus rubinsiae]NIZ93244.1 hypothetical protein [Kineococcus rubinsiae]